MGLLDLFKRNDPQPDLRTIVFGAVLRGDGAALASITESHSDAILVQFPAWQRMPEDTRAQPEALEQYAQALIGLAHYYAEVRQDTRLLEMLQRNADSPFAAFDALLERSKAARDALRFAEARAELERGLSDLGAMQGPAAEGWTAVLLGAMGDLAFQQRDRDAALRHNHAALAKCEALDDSAGIWAYCQNLFDAHRYYGEGPAAAAYAARLTTLSEPKSTGALWFEAQERLCLEGEPLLRMVTESESGDLAELKDSTFQGRVHIAFRRNRPSLLATHVHSATGADAGRSGDFVTALEHFTHAAQSDPFDPDPHYQLGVSHLYLRYYDDAAAAYARTDALAPGWFNCRSYRRLAVAMQRNELTHELMCLVLRLDDELSDPATASKALRAATEHAGELGLVFLQLGRVQASVHQPATAIKTFRRGLECEDDPDSHCRMLFHLAMLLEGEERSDLLHRVRAIDGHLFSSAAAYASLRTTGDV